MTTNNARNYCNYYTQKLKIAFFQKYLKIKFNLKEYLIKVT